MFERGTAGDRARRDARDWLSDEVVVDFPSMAELVGRMRTSFFGINDYEQTTHTTEVNLTPKEADEGTRVPVALPVHLTCPVCGGRGEVWNEVCGVCTGTGGGLLSHNLNVRVPPGVHHGTQRWTPSTGQLINVAKWNLLRYLPVKMRGAEDDKEETAQSCASV